MRRAANAWFEVEFEDEGVALYVEAAVDRGRPAPPCSDPDSPRFSDPGYPPEVELLEVEVLLEDGGARPATRDEVDRWLERLYDEALDRWSPPDEQDPFDRPTDDGDDGFEAWERATWGGP